MQTILTNVILSNAKILQFARLPTNAIPKNRCHPAAEHELRSERSTVCPPPSNAIPHNKCHPGAKHEVRSEGSAVCSPPSQAPSPITTVILERSTKCAAKDLRFARPPTNAIPHNKCHPGAEREVRSEGSTVCPPPAKAIPNNKRHPGAEREVRSEGSTVCPPPAKAIPNNKRHPGAEREVRSEGSAVGPPQQTPSHITDASWSGARSAQRRIHGLPAPSKSHPQ